ncbi:hypothetical protein HJFPF1_11524 [Paramyrothecium foliicola]|nr:hypothetical protein HJFPF1_11524 [Paramyrothecium foliicola]
MSKSLIALTAACLLGSANAFWRMECPGRVGLARIDPIMNPGAFSTHVHAIHGSSGFSQTSLTSDLLAADCTSCRVTQDKSSYWHPAMYFEDGATGEYELVNQVGGMLAYYLLNGENITAFPPGFRMMSGDNERRTYTAGDPSKPDPEKSVWAAMKQTGQDVLAQRALGFNCLNYAKDPEATLYRHYMPEKPYLDANCKDGLRLEVMFPSCWNGQDLDSDNHRSHVAFPDLVMTGTCPEGFDVRLPSLLYETIWDTSAFEGRNGRFVLANGDTTGYGYHGDFIMGWEEAFLQQAVDTCTNASGRIEDCPLFDIIDEPTAKKCEIKVPEALASEEVEGPVKKLPGTVDIGAEVPAEGQAPEESAPAAPAKPTLTYAPGHIPENPASPLPGDVFKEKEAYEAAPPPPPATTSTTFATSAVAPPSSEAAAAAPVVTSEPAPPPPPPPPATTAPPPPPPEQQPEESVSFWSTQYVTNGNVPDVTMPALLHLRLREEHAKSGSEGLGLGWVLPLAIGGGILLFLAVGLLLSWKLKERNKPCTTRVYSMGDVEMHRRSRSRLTKRRGLGSEYSASRFSSRLSFTLPPVLPPLPSYDGFLGHQRGRTRERSWVDEDALHGPKVRRSVRDSWIFNSPSWFGRAPTLPAFEMTGPNQPATTLEPRVDRPNDDGQQQLPQTKDQDVRAPLKLGQTAPMLAMQHGALRHWSRPGAQPFLATTDNNLQDILRLTEQRLRTGNSQLFERSMLSSSTETSLSKPSDSGHSLHLLGNGQTKHLSAAPNKRPAEQRGHPVHRRNSSVFSVASTTNNAAGGSTHDLELLGLGGRQTFGCLNADDDEPQIDLDASPPKPRRNSGESHASSSLSTLYSVGDAEEDRFRGLGVDRRAQLQAAQQTSSSTAEAKTKVAEPRPLRRQTVNIATLGVASEGYAMPMPLGPISANPKTTAQPGPFKMAVVLHPPKPRASEEVRPKGEEAAREMGYRSVSETSKVSESSDSDHEPASPELPSAKELGSPQLPSMEHKGSPPKSPANQGTHLNVADVCSSPASEGDLTAILMSYTDARRNMPMTPSDTFVGTNNLAPTKPTPRPRLKLASDLRRASVCSSVGSDYEGDSWMVSENDFATPGRRMSTLKLLRSSQAVGNTVAQLRRMNSTMSNYSVASVASTAVDPEPLQQRPLTYSHSHSRSHSSSRPSSRHYLNLGGGLAAAGSAGAKARSKHQQQQQLITQRRRSRRMSLAMQMQMQMQMQPTLPEQPGDHGKENQAPELRMPYADGPSGDAGAGKHATTFSRDLTLVGRSALSDELKTGDWRASRVLEIDDDDLSMYDNGDGFLQSSPEREAKNRCLRM